MFKRILVAVDTFDHSQAVLDLVTHLATDGVTQVHVLHLREREISGSAWYSRESSDQAALLAQSAIFELRMAGLAAGGDVRPAIVDRVAEAILQEAQTIEADLIVLGRPRRGELTTRLFGSVTLRVIRRSSCPVIVAPRLAPRRQRVSTGSSAPGQRS